MDYSKILILDFGSQYTQLIARRVREANVYCEIHPFNWPLSEVEKFGAKGVILSGSPASVTEEGSPVLNPKLLSLGLPVLGICYGMQSISKLLGGEVVRAGKREYGRAMLTADESHPVFSGIKSWPMPVWMSHGDKVERIPDGFRVIARSDNSSCAIISNAANTVIGVQFHPEVTHTPEGGALISNFLFKICECKADWTMDSFIEIQRDEIRNRVGEERVILGLSGGVDSSVAAMLLHSAIGEKLTCIFVDNGLLRKSEAAKVEKIFRDNFHINLEVVDASQKFLSELSGVEDPEKKRKIIGRVFIEVFEERAKRLGDVKYLAQGTLYPDVIESVSFRGPSAMIKSHHNVGGLPEKMGLSLVEPFRELFKDEVREVGRKLGMPEEIVARQPFPGPGLAVRVVGNITRDRLDLLRDADDILMQEIKAAGLYNKIWQCFCVLLPVKSVGVMGDERTYENVVAVRAVTS
ncbi:MAG TPA: glutamine-hydrolyzing GMP synthase, partial [bacterium]|nr:glutamine-hydrolyzing GMP synthase [bacterium]